MTIQTNDIYYEDRKPYAVTATPLEDLLSKHSVDARDFCDSWSTSCYRGYRAYWFIQDEQLFLRRLVVPTSKEPYWLSAPAALNHEVKALAGATKFPIPAIWFTGEFTIGIGEPIPSGHAFGLYPSEQVFKVKGGLVLSKRRRTNVARSWVELAQSTGG
ncbi:hypothetical protein [Rhizobium terrae]|uniref:hypothetical protein n=1 Tax=Rhizobium terrae TaxID=2171756 RepID=UPI000E3BB0D7|nr:hypothetical protein [Rhizobium terrae]